MNSNKNSKKISKKSSKKSSKKDKEVGNYISDDLIKNIKKSPINTAKKLSVEELVELLKYLSDKYYNTDEPVVSDEIFDLLKEHLKSIDPDNSYLDNIGAPIKGTKKKVGLPFPMGSLDKIKSEDDLAKWTKKYSGKYMLSDKLDGISSQLYKDDNGKIYLYSRGDGIEGQDISHLIPIIFKNIDLEKIPNETSIRGELILKKKEFLKIKDKMKNARNAVAGVVNSKTVDLDIAKLVDFIAYSILHPLYPQHEQFELLKTYKFKVVEHWSEKKLSFNLLSDYLIERREDSPYEVDGIVVIDSSKSYKVVEGNPEYGFAFKTLLNDQIAEATVIDVLWEPTMDAYMKPTIEIEPVELVGVTITSATAFNAKFVVDNNLGPGAVVKLIRSGDVIPHILEVIKPAEEPKMPDVEYNWIKPTNVDIELINPTGEYKEMVTVKKIVFFFKSLGVKYFDEGIVRKLVTSGYDSIAKILNADKKKLEKIDGIGTRMIAKIFDSIETSFQKMNLNKFMAASHILGRGVGEKKLKLIFDKYPDIFIKKIDDEELYDKIMCIKGYSYKTTKKVVENIQQFKDFYNSINEIIDISHIMKVNKKKKNVTDNKFENMSIVFTGFRNKEWEDVINNSGGKVTTSVSSNTSIVVFKDSDEESSKVTKAKKLKITLMSMEEFQKKYF